MNGRRAVVATAAWGLFCACSWTWCIGMYLPKLLLEHFGWPGFVVFAVPNVLGAAAFGWVVANRRSSEVLVARHGPAMVVFSLVAATYNVFFVALLLATAPPGGEVDQWELAGTAALVFGFALSLAWARDREWLVLSVIVYAISMAAFLRLQGDGWSALAARSPANESTLLWLAPAIALGFLLCPYLDLTFHRAIREAPSRAAFAIFGVAFSVMILLTCFVWFVPEAFVSRLVAAHLLGQTAFTIGAHLREVRLAPGLAGRAGVPLVLLVPLVGALIPPLAAWLAPAQRIDETIYLRFLGCFGLVFPAYVLTFIGPWKPVEATRRAHALFAVVVVVLAPFFELAFVHKQGEAMLVPLGAFVAWVIWRHAARRAA